MGSQRGLAGLKGGTTVCPEVPSTPMSPLRLAGSLLGEVPGLVGSVQAEVQVGACASSRCPGDVVATVGCGPPQTWAVSWATWT